MFALVLVGAFPGCKSTSGLLEPADETAEAGEIIRAANRDLKEIRKLYDEHSKKREHLKDAMIEKNEAEVRRVSDELVYAIGDGAKFGKSALDKIDEALDKNINEDYTKYLRLKRDTLKRQLDAFEEYRQAARKLRDSYEPKNAHMRATVEAEFKERSENFQRNMEKAREFSSEANEFAKEITQQEQAK